MPGGDAYSLEDAELDIAALRGQVSLLDELVYQLPSGDTTGAADLAKISGVLSAGQAVHLVPGTYYLNGAIGMGAGQVFEGAGHGATVIHQVSTTADGFDFTAGPVTLRGFTLAGPGSGTGKGISGFGNPLNYVFIEDVEIQSFGSDGVNLGNALISHLTGVISQLNGGKGFALYVDGGPPTTTVLDACFANANTGTAGFWLSSCQTHVLNACGAEGNTGSGYDLESCKACTLNGCDAETNGSPQVKLNGGIGNVINGMNLFKTPNAGTSIALTGETFCTISGPFENTPVATPTAFVSTDASSGLVLIQDSHSTANSFAAGTCFEITKTGGVAH